MQIELPNQKFQLSNLGTFFPFFIPIKKGSLYSQSLWYWAREKSTLEQVETELSTTHKNPRNLWRSKKKYKLNHKKIRNLRFFIFMKKNRWFSVLIGVHFLRLLPSADQKANPSLESIRLSIHAPKVPTSLISDIWSASHA